MNGDSESFLSLPKQDRRDVFEAAASRLDTLPGYVEKDFWVCLVLDALYNRLPDGHPRLLFKGGTSLSKAWKRFEEAVPGQFIEGEMQPRQIGEVAEFGGIEPVARQWTDLFSRTRTPARFDAGVRNNS